MKIAYFTEWSPYVPSGVLRKIIGQVSTWRALGHEVLLITLSPNRRDEPAMGFGGQGEIFGNIAERDLQKYPWAHLGFLNKFVTAPKIARRIRRFSPDILYYRQQGPWYPGLTQILKTAPCVMEINANFAESEHWGSFRSRYVRVTRDLTLKRADGFVCVSDEIAAELAAYGMPSKAIPNSMWGSQGFQLPPTRNKAPAFVFVGSVLTGANSWHGIDKLFPLAASMPDSLFHIVGFTRSDLSQQSIPTNVQFHGPLFGEELTRLYAKCDVGVGTLALHRRKINQTSALKPLEYLMYGLPVILGYEETEAELNSKPYVLSIGNCAENVAKNIHEIRQFGYQWLRRRVSADLRYLSKEVIEARRLGFFENFVRVDARQRADSSPA